MIQYTVSDYCMKKSTQLNIHATDFTTRNPTRVIIGFLMMHFHPREPCLQRVIDRALDILLSDGILQKQSEADFSTVEERLRFRTFKAREKLEDIIQPQQFSNQKK